MADEFEEERIEAAHSGSPPYDIVKGHKWVQTQAARLVTREDKEEQKWLDDVDEFLITIGGLI